MDPKNPYFSVQAYKPGEAMELTRLELAVTDGVVSVVQPVLRSPRIDAQATWVEFELLTTTATGKERWKRGGVSLRFQLNVISEGVVTCESRYRQQFERELLLDHERQLAARIELLTKQLQSVRSHPALAVATPPNNEPTPRPRPRPR